MFTKLISLLVFAIVGGIDAQITYLPVASIAPAWTGTASPVEAGNGVYLSPDGALAVVVSKDASVKAFNSLDGSVIWTATAPTTTAQSFGGAFFCYGATQNILYSYVDANISTVVALNPADGSIATSFGSMQGTVAGTPVTTADCQYVLATHNVDGSKGYFSVFSFGSPTTPALTYEHPVIADEPFGAVGYYWGPVQGNFPGGELNNNDVFIWSFDTNLNLNNASVGTPQFFGFQLPTNPLSSLNVTLIDGNRDYQAKTAPVITDEGLSMYWSVSRSKVYGWVGDGSGRTDFTTNGVNNFGFTRSTMPFSASASTQPSLSNSSDGFVVGTSAAPEIWVWDRNFTGTPTVVQTAAVVSSRLLVSPDDAFVYYATPAPDSSLYQVSSTDLTEVWKLTLSGGIVGDIAQTKNGARVIVADTAGAVTAFSVATADEALSPISAPPVAPTTPTSVTGPPATSPPVSGPPVTTGPSATSGPSSTSGPSNTPVPTTVRMPVAPTPSGTRPTAPTPTGTPPTAPTSDAMSLTTAFVSFVIIATTSICMMA